MGSSCTCTTTEGLDYPVISADGDTVAFESSEALTAADDDSGWIAGLPQITHDGQHVAFQWLSWASNMVSGDTNGTADVFVRTL